MDEMTDHYGLGNAAEGDRSTDQLHAFESLLSRNSPRLILFLEVRMDRGLKSRVSPEDLLQEVFLEALKSRHNLEYRGERPFTNWLLTIAERKIAAACDRLARQPKTDPLRDDSAGSSNALMDVALIDSLTSASVAVMCEERHVAMRRALDHLPPDYREVVILRKLQEMPLKEIAARLNRSEGATAMLLQRALAQLREELQREGITASSVAPPPAR